MDFQDAHFVSPMPPYRDPSSNGDTIVDIVRREPTATRLEGELLNLNDSICGGYRLQETFGEQKVQSGHPSAKDCAVRNQLVTMGNISSLGLTRTGENRMPMKHGVSKRFRTTFSAPQLNRLESEFRLSMYVIGLKRMRLAEELNLEEKQVKIWFQNRRMKYKREQRNTGRKTAQIPYYYCY